VKRLVLFNAGLKSTFLAALASREGEAILCYLILKPEDFHRLKMVKRLAVIFGLPLFTYSLIQAPACKEILLRMLYLVLHVISTAKENQCKCIYHGLSKDDDSRVVPVLDAYVKQLNALVELAQPLYDGKGIWLGQIAVETPLRRLDRGRVIRLGNEWSIPWELTWSCDQNDLNHCGTCKGCKRRKEAFKSEGHDDPTVYIIR